MKVAIIHYWLVTMRGGEKMLEALLEIFPDADIYTHVYDPRVISDIIKSHKIYTSSINRLPFAVKLYQKYMPFMPWALTEFNLQDYDLIISSEAGPAKGIVPNPGAYHLCYCHSPMRYCWDLFHEYFRKSGLFTRFFMKLLTPFLRVWDINSANMVDRFITNSHYTARRIKRYYRRDAEVVFGPAPIERYLGVERKVENFYLFFGQLVDYKRVDIAIEACIASNRKLMIIGGGKISKELLKYKKSGLIHFAGRVSDEEVTYYFSHARALIFPGIEDLGLIPIEANAAGCPVIAYRKGGVLDTVKENVTGIFFDEKTPASLIAALDRFEAIENQFTNRALFTEHVRRFSKTAFIERIQKIIAEQKQV
jgi:glycosyltransferase involved in cell wall biosynthesis